MGKRRRSRLHASLLLSLMVLLAVVAASTVAGPGEPLLASHTVYLTVGALAALTGTYLFTRMVFYSHRQGLHGARDGGHAGRLQGYH